ncbi:MAG: hypothetical protein E5V74_13010, partial [Mesorhizobium sp.]
MVAAGRNGKCGLHRHGSDKYREVPEDGLLALRQQFIAPVKRCAQSLLTRQRRSPAAIQHAKSFVQQRCKLSHAKCIDAASSEFDSKRNSVEAATYVGGKWHRGIVEFEIASGRLRTIQKELHGRKAERLG